MAQLTQEQARTGPLAPAPPPYAAPPRPTPWPALVLANWVGMAGACCRIIQHYCSPPPHTPRSWSAA